MPLNISSWATVGETHVDFNTRLQRRGQDFTLYANTGYTPQAEDTELLQFAMGNLFTDDSGVHRVRVEPFGLTMYHSRAVTARDIVDRIKGAARRTGRQVIEV